MNRLGEAQTEPTQAATAARAPSPITREAHAELLRNSRAFIAVADTKSAAITTVSTVLLGLLLFDKASPEAGFEGAFEKFVYVVYVALIVSTIACSLKTFWAGRTEAWLDRLAEPCARPVTSWEDVPTHYEVFAQMQTDATLQQLREEERRHAFVTARTAGAKMVGVKLNIRLFLATLAVLMVLTFLRQTQ